MFSSSHNLISFRTFVFNKSANPGKKEEPIQKSKLYQVSIFSVNKNLQKFPAHVVSFVVSFFFVFFFATFCFPHISWSHYASLQPPALLECVCSFTGWAPSLPASRGLRGRSWQAGISLFIARPSEQVKTRTMGTS